jgi:hypothetical protein
MAGILPAQVTMIIHPDQALGLVLKAVQGPDLTATAMTIITVENRRGKFRRAHLDLADVKSRSDISLRTALRFFVCPGWLGVESNVYSKNTLSESYLLTIF